MPARLFFSSGDLLADRRYDYARDLQLKGDLPAAADLLEHAIELAPNFPSAWFTLGEVREHLGYRRRAAHASATPARRISFTAAAVVPGETPAHRPSRTRVSKPSRTASRAVARTQWSVASQHTSTWVISWERSQSASVDPSAVRPSNPEDAAACSPPPGGP